MQPSNDAADAGQGSVCVPDRQSHVDRRGRALERIHRRVPIRRRRHPALTDARNRVLPAGLVALEAEPDDQYGSALFAAVPVHCEQQQLHHADRRGRVRPVGCEFGRGRVQPVPAGRDARARRIRSSSSSKKGRAPTTRTTTISRRTSASRGRPAPRGGFLGTLMSEEFVFRAGWARAFSRNGMNDFTGQYNSNPGVVISANRNAGLTVQQHHSTGGSAPVLFRNDANLGPGIPATPVYPMTDIVTGDIRMFSRTSRSRTRTPWCAGIQRKVSTNMAAEIRYVGTLSGDPWAARNFNESEHPRKQVPQRVPGGAAEPAGKHRRGPGCGLRRWRDDGWLSEHFASRARRDGAAADPAGALQRAAVCKCGQPPTLYTGGNWTNATFLGLLAQRNPNPYGFANVSVHGQCQHNRTDRQRDLPGQRDCRGHARNFFVANPDLIGGAFFTLNSGLTEYHSMQVELRRRLAQGLQFQTSYVFGKAMQSNFYTPPRDPLLSSATSAHPATSPTSSSERGLRPAVRPGPPVHGRRRCVDGAAGRRLADRRDHQDPERPARGYRRRAAGRLDA